MRKQIMTHLKSRSEAIRVAVKDYNKAVKGTGRGKLDPEQVLQYSYIGQFSVLKDTRNAITEKPWAVPANRIARDAWFKSERAKEEITRVEVEVARLRSWIEKEEALYSETLKTLSERDKGLAGELSRRFTHLKHAHSRIRHDLNRIHGIYNYKPSFTYSAMSSHINAAPDDAEEDAEAQHSDAEEEAQQALDNLLDGVANAEALG